MEEQQLHTDEIQETPQGATGGEQPVTESPSLSELTGGQFEDVNELWTNYQEYANQIANAPDQEEYDDYLNGIIKRYKETGDLKPYFEAMSQNYDEMSAEGVLRAKFRNENPEFSEDELDYMFQRDVLSKYPLDPEKHSEREIAIGQKLLEKAAEKERSVLKQEQQKYLSDNSSKQDEAYQKALQEFNTRVDNDESVKSLLANKSLSVKYGDQEVSYGVNDPDTVIEMIKDNSKFWQLFQGEGGADINKAMMVFSFAADPEGFLKTVAASSKAQGTEEVLDEIKNPSFKDGGTPQFGSEDKKAALLSKFLEARKTN